MPRAVLSQFWNFSHYCYFGLLIQPLQFIIGLATFSHDEEMPSNYFALFMPKTIQAFIMQQV